MNSESTKEIVNSKINNNLEKARELFKKLEQTTGKKILIKQAVIRKAIIINSIAEVN